MPKSRLKIAAAKMAAEGEALPVAGERAAVDAADDALDPEDWAIVEIRKALKFQLEQIRMKPSKTVKAANQKARDSRTLSELVRTLERLDAVAKRREGKGKSKATKPRDDRDDKSIKDEFVRRLDQLLATGNAGDISRKP